MRLARLFANRKSIKRNAKLHKKDTQISKYAHMNFSNLKQIATNAFTGSKVEIAARYEGVSSERDRMY